MKDTSDGLQVDPRKFLTDYSEKVASAIRELQLQRQPSTGERAMEGAEGMSIADKARRREIIV